MAKDDQENVQPAMQQPGRTGRPGQEVCTLAFKLTALALAAFSLSAMGAFMLKTWLRAPAPETADAGGRPATAKAPPRLFRDWPRDPQPALVLLLSGEQHGYPQPCGCSRPQLGGLERRYNFVQGLIKERGWPVVAVDLGDIAQHSGPQALVKYKYSMEALRRLNYTAVGIGQNEMSLPLIDALAEYALDHPSPRVLAANLLKKEENFPEMLHSWTLGGQAGGLKVGVAGIVASTVAEQVKDPAIRFGSVEKALPGLLKELQAQKPDLLVLLFQGSTAEAKACASKFPQFHVILSLTRDEEPPEKPDMAGDTMIIGVGHKGRYVGLVGVYRTGRRNKPWALHYQLVPLGEEYETPPGKDADNPILALLEEYTKEVKRNNYLAQYRQAPHPLQIAFPDATYVGSEKCKKCHEEAYQIWKDSPHWRAYESLVNAKRPSLRQYDGECIVCHVTGFGYKGGFTDENRTPQLKDNGCENCHGPGSLHVKGNKTPKMLALMNPCKTQPDETPEEKAKRLLRLNDSCTQCHDIDNDVNWKLDKWVTGKIIHMTPKDP